MRYLEKDFQKWMIKELIPSIDKDADVLVFDGNYSKNGVSDLLVGIPNHGVYAIELKYTNLNGIGSSKMITHRLSLIQGMFLEKWSKFENIKHSLVIVGTSLDDFLVYSGNLIFPPCNFNEILFSERIALASFHESGINFKSKKQIQKSNSLKIKIDNFKKFLFEYGEQNGKSYVVK